MLSKAKQPKYSQGKIFSTVLCKCNIALYSSLKLVVLNSAYGRTQLCA